MSNNQRVGFTPPTPRSRRLGRALRALREGQQLRLEDAGKLVSTSASRIQRIESGDIKARPGDVMELLRAYQADLSSEQSEALIEMARTLKEGGWWQRAGELPPKYLTFIAYEAEAVEMRNFEPTLVPGLLQTEAYARAVVSAGRETETAWIEERVQARLRRQALLTRRPGGLRFHAVLTEAALRVEVGSQEILREQLNHLVELSRRANIAVQVLRYKAGAHLAIHGGFALMRLEQHDPPLGYTETMAGAIFLEDPSEVERLHVVYDQLRALAQSPAESVAFIEEIAK